MSLNYYKKNGVIQFNDQNFLTKFLQANESYNKIKKELIDNLSNFNMNTICKLNIDLWK